jgi:hypothetical protein
MCHLCPSISAEEAAQIRDMIPAQVSAYHKTTDQHLKTATDLEDQYRSSALYYHTSQQSARQPEAYSYEALERLKQAFELDGIDQYNAVFARLAGIIRGLIDVRCKSLSSNNLEKLYHACYVEFVPTIKRLEDELANEDARFNKLEHDAMALYDVSCTWYEFNADGQRCAWHDPSTGFFTPPSLPTPTFMGEEWFTFRQWVASLPETQRAIQAIDGAYVDMIARQLLYTEPEGHVLLEAFVPDSIMPENLIRDSFVEGLVLEGYLPEGFVPGGRMPMPGNFEPDSFM